MDPDTPTVADAAPGGSTEASLHTLIARCGLQARPAFETSCLDTYVDTHDGRLRRRGCRLFHRAGLNRWYLEMAGEPTADQPGLEDRPPSRGPVGKRIRRLVKGRRLIPFLTLSRRERVFRSPIAPEGWSLRVRETVFRDPQELRTASPPRHITLDGSPDPGLVSILADLLPAADAAPGPEDPFEDGLSALGIPLPGAHPEPDTELSPDDTVAAALEKILRRQAFALRASTRGAVYDLDPEYVHQLRVACRRGRAALRIFGTVLSGPEAGRWRSELSRFGRQLGRVRDLDVLSKGVRRRLEGTTVPAEAAERILEAIETDRREAQEEAARALISPEFETLVRSLQKPVPAPEEPGSPEEPLSLAAAAPRLLARALDRFGKLQKRRGKKMDDTRMHRLRIRIKRLRYVLEFLKPALDPAASSSIKYLVGLQTCLGQFNDARVAEVHVRALIRTRLESGDLDADDVLALGILIQAQQAKMERKRGRFRKLWKRFPEEMDRLRSLTGARP